MAVYEWTRNPSWYVIQVPTGKERKLCRVIERVAGNEALEECFCPSFITEKKVRGEWVSAEMLLFPGYVIAVVNDLPLLMERLRGVQDFTRMVKLGESIVPLADADRAWIEAFTSRETRAIPMSTAVMEGDHIVVQSGPLVGHEAWIKRVNRRKSLAYIELNMFGRTIETTVGLGIVKAFDGTKADAQSWGSIGHDGAVCKGKEFIR